jgi:uncharacterized membrane protein YphA (DoxX/SURF4 family)
MTVGKPRIEAVSEPAMGASPMPRKSAVSEGTAVVARWVLGGLFIFMGLHKVLDPVGFLKLARQYDMVTSPLWLNTIAATLPWFEVVCGLLLVAGIAVRGAALVTIMMLIPFSIIVLRRALAIAAAQHLPFCTVKFDCGCGAGEIIICNKLAENLGLLLLAIWLLTGRGRLLSLRYKLLP